MSSRDDVAAVGRADLRLDAGEQALVTTGAVQRPIRALPPSAFENLVVVTTDSPAAVERELRELDASLGTVGVIPIATSGVGYDGPLWTTEAIAPDDLTGLSMRYTQALEALSPGHGWVLFDSLDVPLLYAHEDRVLRFLDHATTRAAERDVRGAFAVVRDAVGETSLAELGHVFERTVDLQEGV